ILLREVTENIEFIVVDTVACSMGAGDENSAADVAKLFGNATLLKNITGAHVALVHHTGKDASKGARGSYTFHGSPDTITSVTADGTKSIAEVVKQRDRPKGEKFAFDLMSVDLGVDQDGNPRTSCVVRHDAAAPPAKREAAKERRLAAASRVALEAL